MTVNALGDCDGSYCRGRTRAEEEIRGRVGAQCKDSPQGAGSWARARGGEGSRMRLVLKVSFEAVVAR